MAKPKRLQVRGRRRASWQALRRRLERLLAWVDANPGQVDIGPDRVQAAKDLRTALAQVLIQRV